MIKDNIILTSGGFNDAHNFVSNESKALFKRITQGKNVMILANAAPEGTGNFDARENVKKNFLQVGATKVDIVDLKEENMHTMLDYDVIYGLGGDPLFLIELSKNPMFRNTLISFLERGIYIGESAGSTILCADLEWLYLLKKGTKPKYDIQLDTYEGLNLTKYKIFPHWDKVSDDLKKKVQKYEEETGIEITKLNNGEFIITSFPI